MNRIEKCKVALNKGYRYCHLTGNIFGLKKNIIKRKCSGYIVINLNFNGKEYNLYGHQFAWFCVYNEIVVEIDHINGNRSDNRISNLRSVTHHQNTFNNNIAKGYCFDKSRNKFLANIKINQKQINLGRYDTELEARNAYLNAKVKYHSYD